MKGKATGLTGFVREIYGKGFVGVMVTAALMSMLAAGARMVQILYLGRIVDGVTEGFRRVLSLFLIITIALITHLVFNALWGSYSARHTARLMAALRKRLAGKLCRADYAALEAFRDGDILSIVTRDLQAIRAWAGILFQAGFIPVKLGISLTACFLISWKMTVVVIPLVPLIAAVGMAVSGSLYTFHVEEKAASGRLNALLNDTAGFMIVVKTFCLEHLFTRKNRRALSRVIAARDRVARRESVVRALNTSLGHVGFVLIFLTGSLLVMSGEIEIGDMIAFIFLANFVGEGMSIVQRAPVIYRDGCAARERLEQVLTIPEEAPGGEWGGRTVDVCQDSACRDSACRDSACRDSASQHVDSKASAGGDVIDEVFAFDDVSFGYTPDRAQLRHISFTVRQGERIAVMGASGSGKSTLFKLMCGLYHPTSGYLRRQGRALREVPVARLRADLAVAPQDSFLFFDTLAANVKIGRPVAGEEDVVAACRRARIHDFITDLPDGYETIVGERGYRLSGGEKQRIAIARVILKDPRILVLDEATSHLDSESEALIQQALERVMEGRTSLVIAHRLSTVLSADRILVMDEGRLVEQGTHEELLAQDGLYARLYRTQFGGEDVERDGIPLPARRPQRSM
jgi:ABC-type multidrug transport system fused ATPase/permease subunit